MENDTFRYSYSSSLQEELKDIKKKYAEQPEDQQEEQLELLRKLDKSSTRKSTIVSIAVSYTHLDFPPQFLPLAKAPAGLINVHLTSFL